MVHGASGDARLTDEGGAHAKDGGSARERESERRAGKRTATSVYNEMVREPTARTGNVLVDRRRTGQAPDGTEATGASERRTGK